MRRFIDFHAHSNASDGQLTPTELVDLAEGKRLAAVAMTDHDTIDGLAEARKAAARYPGLRFINGIEISAVFPVGTLHILGLGIDDASPALETLTRQLRDARNQRNPRIIAKLQQLGMKIDMDDVLAAVADVEARGQRVVVGRVHIAEALRRKGYVADGKEAFNRFLGTGKPAFVDKERLTPREAMAAILASGGIAVLAHPPELKYENTAQLERIVRGLMRDGLGGIEAYHTDNTEAQTRLFLKFAARFKLAVTGGSDYHGKAKPNSRLGIPRVPASVLSGKLRELVAGGQ